MNKYPKTRVQDYIRTAEFLNSRRRYCQVVVFVCVLLNYFIFTSGNGSGELTSWHVICALLPLVYRNLIQGFSLNIEFPVQHPCCFIVDCVCLYDRTFFSSITNISSFIIVVFIVIIYY